METMCCVLLGKAEAKGNGCGQTIVLEREQERNIRRRQRGREENGKATHSPSLSDLPMYACTHVCKCTHEDIHINTRRSVPAEVLFAIIRWWECATAR